MELTESAGGIASADNTGVNRKGSGYAGLSTEIKRQWPLRGGQQ